MRKIGIILIFILLLVSGCNSSGYDTWKDTHNVYGDGTYVSYHSTYDGRSVYGINNTICNQSVVEEILSEKTNNDKTYIYGMFYPYKVYMIINNVENTAKYYVDIKENEVLGMTNINELIASGTFEFLQSYDDFSDAEKEMFDSLVAE